MEPPIGSRRDTVCGIQTATTTGTSVEPEPAFKIGDRVRLKMKPEITGDVTGVLYSTSGRRRVNWDASYLGATLHGFYWPEELELVPEPPTFDELLVQFWDGLFTGPAAIDAQHLLNSFNNDDYRKLCRGIGDRRRARP